MNDITVKNVEVLFNERGTDIYVNALLTDDKINSKLEVGFDRSKPRNAYIQATNGKLTIYD